MAAPDRPAPERRFRRREPEPPPEVPAARPWSRRAAFLALRLGVWLGVSLLVYLLFPAARAPDTAILERGSVAPQDVIASFPFQIPKAEEELRRERDQAAAGVPPVYDLRPLAADSVAASLEQFFGALAAPPAAPGGVEGVVRRTLAREGVPVTPGGVAVLADPALRAVLAAASVQAVRDLFPLGVAPAPPARGGVSAVRVRGVAGGERLVPADSLVAADAFYRAAAARLPAALGPDAAEVQRLLLVRYFRPSLVLNPYETEAARARAGAAVDPVKARVLVGEKIVGAREQIGDREEERLAAYYAALEARGVAGETSRQTTGRAVGAILYNLLLLGIVGFVLRLSREKLWEDGRAIVFLGALALAVAALAAVVARLGLPGELIPVPFATLVVAVLWGGRLALVVALVLALLLGGQTPFLGLTIPFEAAVGGAAAAFGIRLAQRRLQTWYVVGIIALAYAASVCAVGLLRAQPVEAMLVAVTWGTVNATASTLLAVGFLPVAEWFTRVTTNQTLMELVDPNHPLLRRLSMEAPGTYAHTIAVANLAEAVCNAIGANALLARVGVYYHDVGKIVKPQYFIENQPRGRNPHDRLKPTTSAAILRSHVAEGVRLAEEYRLPDAVKAFIREHHGTQTISFFLDQARAADPDARFNPAEFQYAGPRPQSKETAVLMLADSVESAARVLQDPTSARIRELVDRIVAGKIAAGQLDESPLTLHEIHTIKQVLARSLGGMYHQRVDYPAAPAAAPAPPPAEPPRPAAPGTDGAEAPAAGDAPLHRGPPATPAKDA